MNKAILYLDKYIEYLNSNLVEFDSKYNNIFMGQWNTNAVRILDDEYRKLIRKPFYESDLSLNASLLDQVRYTNEYLVLNDLKWNVVEEAGGYCVLNYGKTDIFVPIEFVDIIEIETYANYSPNQVKQLLATNSNISSHLPDTLNSLSITDIKSQEKSVNDKMEQLELEMKNVKDNQTDELAALKKEIDE